MTQRAFEEIAHRIDVRARLTRHWTLTGGVSAVVQGLELAFPDGHVRRYVVRQRGTAVSKLLPRDAIATEFALLEALHRAGESVPKPIFVDVSGEVLPAHYFVMEFVNGSTDVNETALEATLARMAAKLADIHSLDLNSVRLPPLPRREDPLLGALRYLPFDDENASLRSAVAAQQVNNSQPPALLHGDFWPGNILWNGAEINAVIDWEDAAIGDPLSDLAGCRLELLWKHGEQAMDAFTTQYRSLTRLNVSDLPVWEIYVASAAMASMSEWGLEPAIESDMRLKAASFIHRAARGMQHQSFGN